MKALNINNDRLKPRYVLSRISNAKNEMVASDDYLKKFSTDDYSEEVSKIYELYSNMLARNNAMDFDDLILNTINLLDRNEDVLEFYSRKFKYVNVDEYQDTNKAQYKLIKLLTREHNNLCVVGDLDQSIYGWRGADIRNIRDFEKDYENASVIKLEQNYRSSKNILDAANSVIKNNMGRKPKNLWTDRADGNKIMYHRAHSDIDEASYVVAQIKKHNEEENRNFSDFAILYRTNAQSRLFEEALMKQGISYTIVGGHKFYERKEIKDIFAYLRVIQNPSDSVSFGRIINSPRRGVGAKTIEKIQDVAINENIPILIAASLIVQNQGIKGKAAEGIKQFLSSLAKSVTIKDSAKVSEIIEDIIITSGYLKALEEEKTIEAKSRIENIQELVSVAKQFEARSETGLLEDFLAEISLMADIDNLQETDDQVVLMTLHSAKGLEYPIVFLSGMEETIFPTSRAINTADGDIEEERRLAYVGITRAEDILYLTNASQRMLYGRTQYLMTSRFVDEIDKELLEIGGKKPTQRELIEKHTRKANYSFGKKYINKTKQTGEVIDERIDDTVYTEIVTGAKIKHNSFGEGLIISINESGSKKIATIAFNGKGIKKLDLNIAAVELIN
jgi:DNA helicase-2/ATP-dependent DNA helicase PcrA